MCFMVPYTHVILQHSKYRLGLPLHTWIPFQNNALTSPAPPKDPPCSCSAVVERC